MPALGSLPKAGTERQGRDMFKDFIMYDPNKSDLGVARFTPQIEELWYEVTSYLW